MASERCILSFSSRLRLLLPPLLTRPSSSSVFIIQDGDSNTRKNDTRSPAQGTHALQATRMAAAYSVLNESEPATNFYRELNYHVIVSTAKGKDFNK